MSSDLTFNKIAGGLLATGLAIVGLGELSNIVYKPEPMKAAGYAIAVQEASAGGGEAVDVVPDWGTVLPTANVQAGATVAEKCKSCHNLDNGGPNLTGPNLYGVLGRKPGSHPGFPYSDALRVQDFTWDPTRVDAWITNPAKTVPGTKMTFAGLANPKDRTDVIAYLMVATSR